MSDLRLTSDEVESLLLASVTFGAKPWFREEMDMMTPIVIGDFEFKETHQLRSTSEQPR